VRAATPAGVAQVLQGWHRTRHARHGRPDRLLRPDRRLTVAGRPPWRADLADKAGAYTGDAAIFGAVAGGAVALAWATGLLRGGAAPPLASPPPPAEADEEEAGRRLKDRV